MSFRYTNNLVGVLKHRLVIEAAHRAIARRTFIGACNGIEVECSGYGTVLAIRLVDRKTWEPFYARRSHLPPPAATHDTPPESSELAAEVSKDEGHEPATAGGGGSGGVDFARLSQSIRTATWQANRLIRAAKEEAHARAVLHNPQSRAKGSLRDWYEVDATSMHPRPFDALKQEAATPWMQAVRFAKPNPGAYLAASGKTDKGAPSTGTRVSVLEAADCDPLVIPIGAAHPLYTPALTQLETFPDADADAATSAAAEALTGRPNLSRANAQAVLCEQKKEMSRDEQQFWEKVELIRRAQLATIPNGASKRGYADMAAVVADDVQDKVELKFTQ